jgi:hypothetical protein
LTNLALAFSVHDVPSGRVERVRHLMREGLSGTQWASVALSSMQWPSQAITGHHHLGGRLHRRVPHSKHRARARTARPEHRLRAIAEHTPTSRAELADTLPDAGRGCACTRRLGGLLRESRTRRG